MKNFSKLISPALLWGVLNVFSSGCNCYENEYIPRPSTWKVQEGYIGFTNYDSLWAVPASFSFDDETKQTIIAAAKAVNQDTCEYLGISWHSDKPKESAEFAFSEYNVCNVKQTDMAQHEISSRHCMNQLNSLTITEVDSVKRTISGKFTGTLCYLNKAGKQIIIRDGQFRKVPF